MNSAEALTSVNEPEAVNVKDNTVVFAPAEWLLVLAIVRARPLVVISPPRVVSVTAGVNVLSVRAIKLTPTPPAELLVQY